MYLLTSKAGEGFDDIDKGVDSTGHHWSKIICLSITKKGGRKNERLACGNDRIGKRGRSLEGGSQERECLSSSESVWVSASYQRDVHHHLDLRGGVLVGLTPDLP